MWQTRTSIHNASEHTRNDEWNNERQVLLSEDWIGTARFRMLRIKLPGGHTWVNGRPTNVQTISRLDPTCQRNGPDFKRNKHKRRLQPGTMKRSECKKLADKEEASTFHPQTQRRPQGDLRRSSDTRKVRESFDAVYS